MKHYISPGFPFIHVTWHGWHWPLFYGGERMRWTKAGEERGWFQIGPIGVGYGTGRTRYEYDADDAIIIEHIIAAHEIASSREPQPTAKT